MADPVRVGLLGCGNVGGAIVRLVDEHADVLTARAGVDIEIGRVAVRDVGKPRDLKLAPEAFTADADAVVRDPSIDVVVEVMGGIDPARALITEALRAGKPVITANKELIARHGPELFAVAAASGVDLLFEASVAGGIPLMRPLRESLAGDRIRRVMGIVNGTTNYILTQMAEEGSSFDDALAEAQRLGYAEADPTADVDGFDAAAKAAIIATIAFGARVNADDVYTEGIRGVTADDIESAATLGYVVKLLAVAEESEGSISVRVHPAMIPVHHPLASVRGSFNAVFIEGEAVGELMRYGRGAGGRPTASAVLGDLIDAASNLGRAPTAPREVAKARIRPIDELTSQYYLNLEVADRPGVLAAVAGVFGAHDVSIKAAEQEGLGDEARLIFITHTARERDMQATLRGLHALDVVDRVGTLLRVIGGD
jgi:homoserine dehydrogenase